MKKLIVTVIRREEGGEPRAVEYEVPIDEGDVVSVMNVLDYISSHLDRTLAYFSHAACRQAVCGQCVVKANGKVVLACRELVSGDKLLLEPAKQDVVRDLICR